jgi:acyl dehydratase
MGLYEDLQAIVGEEDGPFEANDEVNKAMIRHWCEAMEDGNPLYTDEAYAKASEYGEISPPPQMVQAYCIPTLWPKQDRPPHVLARSNMMADKAGYFGVVATSTSQEYFTPMRLGDRLSFKIKLASVSPEKTTRMGTGFFITAEYAYTNQQGELICRQPFTVFKFKPATQ